MKGSQKGLEPDDREGFQKKERRVQTESVILIRVGGFKQKGGKSLYTEER